MVRLRYLRRPVSASRPKETRTSQRSLPRATICPCFLDKVRSPWGKSDFAAHNWHTRVFVTRVNPARCRGVD